MKQFILILANILFFTFPSLSQNNLRIYQSHTWQNQILSINTNEGILTLRPFTDQIIEVAFEKTRGQNPDSSHAVVLQPQTIEASLIEENTLLRLNTPSLSAVVYKNPCKIAFLYKGEVVAEEAQGFFEEDSLKGFTFQLEPTEKLFGTGERALPLNRRGYRLELYNKAHYAYEDYSLLMNYNIPLVMSSKKYLIYFDNAPRGFIDLGKTDPSKLRFESIGGKMTYYLIAGKNFYEITDAYTDLTGKQPLPPRWVLGNFASRYGYRSEAQTREIVAKFPAQDFPLDAVVLDHFWYGEGEIKKSVAMGDLDWYRPKWQTGEQMIKDFLVKGIKTVPITQPFVLTNSKNFEYLSKNKLLATNAQGETAIIPDFYFGRTGLLDIFKPAAQEWFWQQYKRLTLQGVAGWWGDLGEPEMHPAEIRHIAGTADEVHNIYGHYWAKMIYKGYERDFPTQRPFILMRGGFAGSQHYGLIPWSGDVSRSWGGFQSQPALAMSLGLAGLAYMHSDLGGFAGDTPNHELYGRWLQYGVFQPIYRPHAQEAVPAEPVFYSDSTQQIVRKFINLRYELLPYHYTMAFQNHTEGKPLMRPIFFEESGGEEDTFEINDTYFWGDALLVAPIFEAGQQTRRVYLPKNQQWFDFWTKQRYEGGQWITLRTQAETIPVFVRAGAFIPKVPVFENTEEFTSKVMTLELYLSKGIGKAQSICYEDDGKTAKAYEQNQYELWKMDYQKTSKGGQISLQKGNTSYSNAPQVRNITFKVFGVEEAPKKTIVNGKKIAKSKFTYDATTQTFTFEANWSSKRVLRVAWQ